MSITDPFGAGRWVERLWLMRDRILDPTDAWQNTPHLPWETADPAASPMRFEVAGIDSPWNRSRSEKGFVSGILRQFTRSQESVFGYTFAASAWMYLSEQYKACAMLRHALEMDPGYLPALVLRALVSDTEDDLWGRNRRCQQGPGAESRIRAGTDHKGHVRPRRQRCRSAGGCP